MKTYSTISGMLILMCLLANCKTATNTIKDQVIIRQAENSPEYFSPPPNTVLDNQSCKSPMLDVRDGTKIIFLTSSNGVGKYEAPLGSYGIRKGEALLLDCTTGKVMGIVKI